VVGTATRTNGNKTPGHPNRLDALAYAPFEGSIRASSGKVGRDLEIDAKCDDTQVPVARLDISSGRTRELNSRNRDEAALATRDISCLVL